MTARCRAALRESFGKGPLDPETRSHVEACGFCSARLAARDVLASRLRFRPNASVDAERFLAAVRDRVVQQAEHSPLGQLLSEAMPVTSPADSRVRRESMVDSGVARLVRSVPLARPEADWARVRGAIRARVAAEATPRIRRWMVGVAGAAIFTVAFFVLSRGTTEVPTIVFRDLDAADLATLPGVDPAAIRHGVFR